VSEHTGHRMRLRERYKREGLGGFAPHEVLELLLTYAIPRIDTNPIAHALIKRFGSLRGVLEASQAELEQVDGVGPGASALLTMLLPMLRMYEQERLLPRRRLDTYAGLAAYCHTLFLGVNVEQFYLLCFDAQLQLIATVRISAGTPSEVSANPRLLMQELMRHNAVGAVLTHNHPSQSAEPSVEDVDLTMELQRLMRSVGIRLIDHIIIAGGEDRSILRDCFPEKENNPIPLAADRAKVRSRK